MPIQLKLHICSSLCPLSHPPYRRAQAQALAIVLRVVPHLSAGCDGPAWAFSLDHFASLAPGDQLRLLLAGGERSEGPLDPEAVDRWACLGTWGGAPGRLRGSAAAVAAR